MYQLAITLDGRIVGETSASGLGRILSETLNMRPDPESIIDDYLQSFSRISEQESGQFPLVDRLKQAFHEFQHAYSEIHDDGEIPGTQGEYILADGNEYHLHFTFRKERKDQNDFILFTMRNDSQTKQLEESLRKANEGLQGIMAYLLHDLRNIAGTNIQGPLSLVPDEAVDPTYHNCLAIARRNAQTVFKVLSSNLHDFATGRLTIIKEEHDLSAMVRDAMENVSRLAQDKGISFHMDRPDRALIMVDEKLISVFDNLLRNAVTYSPDNTVIHCAITETETMCPGDSYQFTVKNAADLTKEQARAMFDTGQRFSDEEGTGYGLSNVRTLVTYHGGGIYSDVNEGQLAIDVVIPKGLKG
jgi:signal transduction histidine kinase